MSLRVERSQVEAAVAQANPSVLRMALYQLTRDPELADMQVNQEPKRGGAFHSPIVDERHAETIRRKAVEFLVSGDAERERELPSDDDLRSMMQMMTAVVPDEIAFRHGREELAFDEFPREAVWHGEKPAIPEGFSVAIIGAGPSGIAAAVQFERLGIPYDVYERESAAGGTWQVNSYPDARVDTSSFLYQFKFIKNYPWSEYFAAADEVKKYVQHAADAFGVTEHIQFSSSLEGATYDDDTASWTLTLRSPNGTERQATASVIVSAAGQFSTPRLPDIPGVEDFQGDFFHTTAWDSSFDPSGKVVAVIGNGSTGVQLTPWLAERAEKLFVLQRTPQWISPMEGYRDRITPEIRWLFDNVPYYWNWYCFHTQVTTNGMQLAQEYDRDWQAGGGLISERNDGLRAALTAYIGEKLADRPDLIEKVTPDYAPLARRLVVDSGWYDALLRPDVDLVAEGIDHIEAGAIVTKDGRRLEVDAIVFASGFDVSKYLYPTDYTGSDGANLQDLWSKDGPRAYLGMTLPGFPNLFVFYGPNAQPRSGAFVTWSEIWSRYAAEGVVHLLENGARSFELRREVFDDYQSEVDAAHDNLIWQGEAPADKNYYVKDGRQIVHWPFRNEQYYDRVSSFDPDAFTIS
jgi:4-hydroxyacetophenone monooxygenase